MEEEDRMAILDGENVIPPPAVVTYHQAMTTLQDFLFIYKEHLKGKLALARAHSPDSPYTFHMVLRKELGAASCTAQERSYYASKAEKKGGEFEVHRFICFLKVHHPAI